QHGTPSDYFNALEHTVIEAAAPRYLLQPTKVNRPKLKDETLALIDLKHEIQRRIALHADQTTPACGRLQSRFDEAASAAAEAVRAERRRHLAETAKEAEAAEAAMILRRLHAAVRRLAPKAVAPVVAAHNPATGGACQDAEEEVEVRARALSTSFDGTVIDMNSLGGPPCLLPRDDNRIGTCGIDGITEAIRNMPNYKSAPVLKMPAMRDLEPALEPTTDRYVDQPSDGSVIEIWKLCVTETAPALQNVFHACRALGHSAQRSKGGETVSLRKQKGDGKCAKDHYRTINLINHIGKVYMNVTVMPELRGLAPRLSFSQSGSVAGRSRLGSGTTPGVPLAVLIDLEKACDLMDRDEIWAALEALAVKRSARLAVEELHEGTCYIARDI
ncbi:unnamed protein product, partial [Prorocentrum cordatum]